MAEVGLFDDNEDIFLSSLPLPGSPEGGTRVKGGNMDDKLNSSEIESDEEIDTFIACSQTPPRESNENTSFVNYVHLSVHNEGTVVPGGSLSATVNALHQDNGNKCDVLPPPQHIIQDSDHSLDEDLFTQQTQEFEPLSLEMPATQDFEAEIAAASAKACFNDENESSVGRDGEEFRGKAPDSMTNDTQIKVQNANEILTATKKDHKSDCDVLETRVEFKLKEVAPNLEPESNRSKSKELNTDECSSSTCSDDTLPYDVEDVFESQSKAVMENQSDVQFETDDLDFCSQLNSSAMRNSQSILQVTDSFDKAEIAVQCKDPDEKTSSLSLTSNPTDPEFETQAVDEIFSPGPASPPLDFSEPSQNYQHLIKANSLESAPVSPPNSSAPVDHHSQDRPSSCDALDDSRIDINPTADTLASKFHNVLPDNEPQSFEMDSKALNSISLPEELTQSNTGSVKGFDAFSFKVPNQISPRRAKGVLPKKRGNRHFSFLDQFDFEAETQILPALTESNKRPASNDLLRLNEFSKECASCAVNFDAVTQKFPFNIDPKERTCDATQTKTVSNEVDKEATQITGHIEAPTQIIDSSTSVKNCLFENRFTPKNISQEVDHDALTEVFPKATDGDSSKNFFLKFSKSKTEFNKDNIENSGVIKSIENKKGCFVKCSQTKIISEIDFEAPTQVIPGNKELKGASPSTVEKCSPMVISAEDNFSETQTYSYSDCNDTTQILPLRDPSSASAHFGQIDDSLTDFDQPTQYFPIKNSNETKNCKIISCDKLEGERSSNESVFDQPTQCIPMKKNNDIKKSNMNMCDKLKGSYSESVFDQPTQTFPFKKPQENVTSNISLLDKLENSFQDTDFDQPTQCFPLKKSNDKKNSNSNSSDKLEGSFSDNDFDQPTQCFPLKKSNDKKNSNSNSSDKLEGSFSDNDFDQPTQCFPLKKSNDKTSSNSNLCVKLEDSYSESLFDQPTQCFPLKMSNDKKNSNINSSDKLEGSFSDNDFDQPTQCFPLKKSNDKRNSNYNLCDKLQDSYSESLFDQPTQCFPLKISEENVKTNINLSNKSEGSFSDNDFDQPTQCFPLKKSKDNVTRNINLFDKSEGSFSDNYFDQPTQCFPLKKSNDKRNSNNNSCDKLQDSYSESIFDQPTQCFPLEKRKENVKSHINSFDKLQVSFNDNDFDQPTQCFPLEKRKENGDSNINSFDKLESSFRDTDFDQPTQCFPLKKSKENVKSNIKSSGKSEGSFIDHDFDQPTQCFPLKKSNDKRNSNRNLCVKLEDSYSESVFDQPTQCFPLEKRIENVKSNINSFDKLEGSFSDNHFDQPTQILLPNIKMDREDSRKLNSACPSGKSENLVRTLPNSFLESDYSAPTQVLPLTCKRKLENADTNKNSNEKKSMEFGETIWEEPTQIFTRKTDNIQANLEVSFDSPTQCWPQSGDNVLKVPLQISKKHLLKSDYDQPTQVMPVSKSGNTKTNSKLVEEDDSTDSEVEEIVFASSSKAKVVVKKELSLCNNLNNGASSSPNHQVPLPLPPDDFICDNEIASHTAEIVSDADVENTSENEAYMADTQLGSQSMCFSSWNNPSSDSAKKHSEDASKSKKSLVDNISSEEKSIELPTTPEFDRQIAEAEKALNLEPKKTKLVRKNNLSDCEGGVSRPKRMRKTTWKMNELLSNSKAAPSESTPSTSKSTASAETGYPPSIEPLVRFTRKKTNLIYDSDSTPLQGPSAAEKSAPPSLEPLISFKRKRSNIIYDSETTPSQSTSGTENSDPASLEPMVRFTRKRSNLILDYESDISTENSVGSLRSSTESSYSNSDESVSILSRSRSVNTVPLRKKLKTSNESGSSVKCEDCSGLPSQTVQTRRSAKLTKSCDKCKEEQKKSNRDQQNRGRARVIVADSDEENTPCYQVSFATVPNASFRSIVEKLGGTIQEVMGANVFICDKFKRTIKIMSALSQGLAFVTSKWLLDCEAHKKWLNPNNYLLVDAKAEKQWKFSLQNCLRKAADSKLLSGYTVFITQNVTPRPSEIHKLIECSGGTAVKETPRVWPPESLIISCAADSGHWPAKHVKIVDVPFLFNSVIRQELDFTQKLLR